jgi:hypothetical protein
MRAGDLNGDNIVSIADLTIMRSTFGRSLGDPGYDPRADLNGDDVVTVVDLNLLAHNFGLGGENPLSPSP